MKTAYICICHKNLKVRVDPNGMDHKIDDLNKDIKDGYI